MPYPEPYRLNLVAQRIAKLAKVPKHYHHEFSERIVETVMHFRKWDRHSGGLLIEAADAARRLQDTFFRMNQSDRDWVEQVKPSQLQFLAGEINDLGSTINNIVLLLDGALGRPSRAPPPAHC